MAQNTNWTIKATPVNIYRTVKSIPVNTNWTIKAIAGAENTCEPSRRSPWYRTLPDRSRRSLERRTRTERSLVHRIVRSARLSLPASSAALGVQQKIEVITSWRYPSLRLQDCQDTPTVGMSCALSISVLCTLVLAVVVVVFVCVKKHFGRKKKKLLLETLFCPKGPPWWLHSTAGWPTRTRELALKENERNEWEKRIHERKKDGQRDWETFTGNKLLYT